MLTRPEFTLHRKFILFIITLLSFCSLAARDDPTGTFSERIEFEHLGDAEGISKVIMRVHEDSRGFIWLASGEDGLYRYDGYEFRHYTNSHDDSTSLSDNFVTEFLYEDGSGNLWISFFTGELNRYNRATDNFTRFPVGPEDPSGLSGYASSVTGDGNGNIWIGTIPDASIGLSGGLYRYREATGTLTRYQNDPSDPGTLSENYISTLHTDRSGSLWIGTCRSGLDRYLPGREGKADRFIHYSDIPGNPSLPIHSCITAITEDTSGTLWAGTERLGLLRYLEEKDGFRRYPIHPDPSSPVNYINKLAPGPDGTFWIGTGDGLAMYERERDTMILYRHDPADPFSIKPGKVKSIEFGHDGAIWVVSVTTSFEFADGITRFDPETGTFATFKNDLLDPASISSDFIETALIDQNGILWFGTLAGGLNKYDPHKRKFRLLQTNPIKPNGLPQDNIFSIFEDSKGILWIGTLGYGLFRLDRTTGHITNYTHDPDDPNSINDNNVEAICEEPPGILWMGGVVGLKRLDTETMTFRHFLHDPDDPNSPGANHVISVIRDREGILWLATLSGGLNRFDPGTEQFKSYKKDPADPESPDWNPGVLNVYEGLDGSLWLGTFEGLYRFIRGNSEKPDELIHYAHEDDNPNSLSYNTIRAVVEDGTGILWIATGGGGLNKLHIETGEFTIYTEDDGLPGNIVLGILIDASGNLWLSTNNGLSRFDPVKERFDNFNELDGLHGRQFAFGAYFKSPSGEMFFGGGNGITYFYPEEVTMNPYEPPVVITGFSLFNEPVPVGGDSPLKKSITETKELELRHDENFISFEFAALNYTNTAKNRYRYRMLGLNPDTVYLGTRRFADFTDLKPGHYTFWVTGSNNDGKWNREGASLDIIVHPPWWRSGLAYAIYILILLFMIAGFIRWRTYRLRRDKENLERQVRERTREIEEKDARILQMDQMKTRFFANISHEFRTPITLILNPLEEIMEKMKPGDKQYENMGVIRRNGLRLLSLVNQLLDISRLDSGKLKIELVRADIFKFLRLIFASFLSLAEKNRIKYDYLLPDGELVTCFDRGKLETILNNLLSNAFKYTPEEGEITCIVDVPDAENQDDNHIIRINVSDSGPGIDEKNLAHIFDRFYQADEHRHLDGGGTGIGLSLTRELVLLLKGNIEVRSSPGAGTTFVVSIPVGTGHLKESEYIILREPEEKKGETERVPVEETGNKEDGVEERKPGKHTVQILIVEDNDELRSYLAEQFEQDYLVEKAENGEEGLKLAIKNIPDLIISDIMMPGIDGIEFCRHIKSNERTSHIPFIMLTAKADVDSRIEGLETAADDYIIKPFNIQELKTRVKNLIEQRRNLRNRFAGSPDISTKEIVLNSHDLQFMNRIMKIVEEHIDDLNFEVRDLQTKSGLGDTQLYRKIFALTGLSPSKFIRKLRLKRAAGLLEQSDQSVTEIALNSGFSNLSYFTKCFREHYGLKPSDYRKQPGKETDNA